MTTFADELKRAREAAGLSQTRLERLSGVTHSYISRLESGDRDRPREGIIWSLAAAMKCSPAQLDRMLVSAGYLPSDQRLRSLICEWVGLEVAA